MCNAKSFYDPAGIYGGGGDQLHAKLGLGVKPETPDVISTARETARDPEAEDAEAKQGATRASNAKIAQKRARARASSLLAAGGERGVTTSLLAQGKTTLGA